MRIFPGFSELTHKKVFEFWVKITEYDLNYLFLIKILKIPHFCLWFDLERNFPTVSVRRSHDSCPLGWNLLNPTMQRLDESVSRDAPLLLGRGSRDTHLTPSCITRGVVFPSSLVFSRALIGQKISRPRVSPTHFRRASPTRPTPLTLPSLFETTKEALRRLNRPASLSRLARAKHVKEKKPVTFTRD